MADVVVRATTDADIVTLAANMRRQDVAEVHACGHYDLEQVVRLSVRSSVLCATGEVDGALACIFGVSSISLLGGVGSPWLLGTPVLARSGRVLQRRAPAYIAEMLQVFPHLTNRVHARNTVSVVWLRRLGFTLHPVQAHPVTGEMFHPFEMRVSNV